MITRFDDFCIHQTPQPICTPAPSDRNFYDRYWKAGIDIGGKFMFQVAFGVYPNRHVQDAHFNVVVDGVQHCFHGSQRAQRDRSQLSVGPLRIEVLEPLRRCRVVLAPNDTGLECDLTFTARTAAHEEPQSILHDEGRLVMHTSRFTQLGCWHGYIVVKGKRIEVDSATTLGSRDKSWGIRPVGERETGAPGLLNGKPQVYWVWATLDFGDLCTQFNTFQDPQGNPTQLQAVILPAYGNPDDIPEGEDPGIREMETARHSILWQPGTRWTRHAELEFEEISGTKHAIAIEPLLNFFMVGNGYGHPEWGHGIWKGESAHAYECWQLDEVDPANPMNLHIHQLVKATMGNRTGFGIFETVSMGPHEPSGFKDLFDGAPGAKSEAAHQGHTGRQS